MQVRFTLKGRKEQGEIAYTPFEDKEGKVFLRPEVGREEDMIPLKSEGNFSAFTFEQEADWDRFAEDRSIIEERLLGLAGEWLESKDSGIENESEESTSGQKPGYTPDQVFVENKPFSVRQLVDLIDSKDIEISPSFQRNFIWDNTRQSRLIESIFLGLPLPSIYLSQYKDGTLTIVDGLQRLNTIYQFYNNKLRLSNLEYLTSCNGKKWEELHGLLSPLQIRRFLQAQVMCFVIDYRSPKELKYDLFRRLNTGGKPLNNQEIRNCLSRPALQKTLKEMAQSAEFQKATGGSVKDTRMEAQEIALRYMYFCDQYTEDNPTGNYSGNIENILDEYVERLNDKSEDELSSYISDYKVSLHSAYRLFGQHAFRKVYSDYTSLRRSPVNKLLITAITVLLTKHRDEYLIAENSKLTSHLAGIIDSDKTFFDAISWSTNSKANIAIVMRKLKEDLFDRYLTNG